MEKINFSILILFILNHQTLVLKNLCSHFLFLYIESKISMDVSLMADMKISIYVSMPVCKFALYRQNCISNSNQLSPPYFSKSQSLF
uniref:Uncharacterized protein n=1 Tax=Manihot esculenta TaxID=3983 RepID=A0A2C9UVT9_MANES